MTRKSVWNWEQEISEREILNIYRLITQEWVISSLCLIQGNNPNFKLPQLLAVTHPYSSTVIKSLTKNCQLLQSELSCWSVNYSAVGFSLHVSSPMEGSSGSAVSGDFTGGTEGDLWQPLFLGQKEVALFPRQAFGTRPKLTLHSILCSTLEEMLEIWVHCCRSH